MAESIMKKSRLQNGKWKNYISYAVILAFLIVLIVINLTSGLGFSDKSTLPRIAFSCMLAVSLNLVVGFLGELSLGHAGFMCVGAYLGCYLSNVLRDGTGLPELLIIVLSMLVAGVVAAVFGFIIGLPALRLKGDYLAIATLAFGEIVRCIFKNLPFFGGAMGMSTKLYDGNTLFIIAFLTLLFVVFCCQNLINSKHGRAVVAIRDNEIAAKAMGVNVTYYKLLIFMIAAFFAGMAGVLYGATIGTIRQETFSYNYSIEILVMVVLGGMGSINGSLIAAAVITWLNIVLQSQLSGALAPVKSIVYALILILIVVFSNAPAMKGFRESINPRNWRKKKVDAGKINNDAAQWDRIPTKINMDDPLSVDTRSTYADSPVPPDVVVKNRDEFYVPPQAAAKASQDAAAKAEAEVTAEAAPEAEAQAADAAQAPQEAAAAKAEAAAAKASQDAAAANAEAEAAAPGEAAENAGKEDA